MSCPGSFQLHRGANVSTSTRSLNPDSAFVGSAPSSCLVTEWGEWDVCSATCGLGMKRRERLVKMPPADGSICGAEVLEVEKCMMPECRKSKLRSGSGTVLAPPAC